MPSRKPATSFSKRIQDAASLEVLCRTPDSDFLRIEKRLCTQNDGGLGSKGAPLNFSFFRLPRGAASRCGTGFPFSLDVLLGQNQSDRGGSSEGLEILEVAFEKLLHAENVLPVPRRRALTTPMKSPLRDQEGEL